MNNEQKHKERNRRNSKPRFEKDGKKHDRNHSERYNSEKNTKFEKKFENNHKPKNEKPKTEKYDTKQIKLNGEKTLCSFVISKESNITKTLHILEKLSTENINNLVISIPHSEFSEISTKISELKIQIPTDIISYSSTEFQAHNNAFQMHESDIFLVMSSSIEPRPYAIEVLKRYLSREYSVAVVPTVYNANLEIQKYCLRFPSIISKFRCIFGCKKTAKKLIMMERGDSGYYKIHRTDASLSQSFVVNSKIFKQIKMFPKYKDTKTTIFMFYKKLSQYGTTLFVPSSRFIEHKTLTKTTCIISKICYFLKNVF